VAREPIVRTDRHCRVKSHEAPIWEAGDLVHRVSQVLDFAVQAVQSLPRDGWPEPADAEAKSPPGVLYEKVVAETAMLLVCTASVQHVNEGLRERVGDLLALVAPLARNESMLAGVCVDPGLAYDRAVAHAVVSRLGHPDPLVDRLLADSKALDGQFGPERLPLCRLEQEWLARVWGGCTKAHPERGLLSRSMLGRQMDVLGATRFDVYSFTHAIIYATDFGGRRIRLPRPASAIAAEADAALGLSLDVDDFDITAELCMTWPMLTLAWSPTSIFAFGLLAATYDRLGFLPGPTFASNSYEALTSDERSRYMFATCYHTTYVMGMLCAATLREGCRPPKAIAVANSAGSGAALVRLLEETAEHPRWRPAFHALDPVQQDELAPLVLTILLRRAKDRSDLREMRTTLELALAHGLIEGPSVQQAIALLRRSALLSRILGEKSCVDNQAQRWDGR
jgi:hypothetical protein